MWTNRSYHARKPWGILGGFLVPAILFGFVACIWWLSEDSRENLLDSYFNLTVRHNLVILAAFGAGRRRIHDIGNICDD